MYYNKKQNNESDRSQQSDWEDPVGSQSPPNQITSQVDLKDAVGSQSPPNQIPAVNNGILGGRKSRRRYNKKSKKSKGRKK
uniref:Uncharacterized protein n=1 Tax=viral metagenome TaxID=1070528 RepID=A0A6C0HVW0_9ZZZZ